jgi:hypothetical protein
VSTWLITEPAPSDEPFALVAEITCHEKVVKATEFGLVIIIEVDSPEQIMPSEASTSGMGFTVTT